MSKPSRPPGKPVPKKSAPAKRRESSLTSEEEALWHYVAQSVTRLHSAVNRRPKVKAEPQQEAPATRKLPPHGISQSGGRNIGEAQLGAPPSRTKATELATFDNREARNLARGRIAIDARIDLHGLRQRDAHHRLLVFLHTAATKGHRHVLVITGKGREQEDGNTHYVDALERSPRGVLRRSVPMWLEEPDLRGIVLSYREASTSHGGSGALYVRLRSRR